jgi:hypothetical protein
MTALPAGPVPLEATALEDAGAQERVRAGDGFGGVECSGAWRDAVRSERFVSGVGDGFRREGMRQRFEGGVVIEGEVNAFVGVDEDEDARRVENVGHYRIARACIRADVGHGTRCGGQFPAADGVGGVA